MAANECVQVKLKDKFGSLSKEEVEEEETF